MICIYKITSPSFKIYIGQSINFNKRLTYYKNGAKPYQRKIYNSLKKYGFNTHKIEILEECLESQLNDRERYWQDFYDACGKQGLNCRLTKSSDKSGQISQETKDKLRVTTTNAKMPEGWWERFNFDWTGRKHKPETLLKMSKAAKGRKKTAEHIAKLPQNQKGKFRAKHSEETKLKQKLNSGKTKKIFQYDKEWNFIKCWDRIQDARFLLNANNIPAAASGKLKSSGGYKWSYVKL